MPEGHTIHRLAARHADLFAGEKVQVASPQGRFAAGAAVLAGAVLTGTEAYGKHLLHHYRGGHILHVHLGLYGKLDVHDAPPPPPVGQVRMRLVAAAPVPGAAPAPAEGTDLDRALGTLAAYAFSRFRVPGKSDLLFFILSTRMMPPIAIAIPVYLMFRYVGLNDTHLGLIVLYTVVNLSLSVWLLQGFMDEIPREYEEAAMVDGYTRWQAFLRVVLPQAATGIATTAIFCLIFAWNEYAFAALLTSGTAQTAPPFIPTIIGEGGQDWPAVAAGTTVFLVPILVFTILLRKHLLRGITFGAVRK